ncbi:MAG: exported zinc metalloprotease YfgC precursor [Chitinophagaceae bacterium]|jgi:predicted Zn-dependent protease|nr:exported zinc metalloprotease YfgC precursor [Chitinophagaceae bacterium]
MDAPVALYSKTAYDEPIEVRLLVYQEAIQLYHPQTSAFLLSVPLKYLGHFTTLGETVTIHFTHNEDVKLVLEDDHPLLPELRAAEKRPFLKPGGKVLILTLVVIAGVLFLNHIFSSIVADIGLKIITPQYESELGEQMFHSTVPAAAVDERRTAVLQAFADRLALSDNYRIRVCVLRANDANAFAVPGGRIVVFSGLIDKMQGYDEIVALLGHEASHVNQRHTTRAILKEVSSKLFLIFFMDVSQVGAILLLNADKLRGLSYSRNLEKEADEEGLKIMLRNRVDANGMLRMFDRLKEGDTLATPTFLNTHPLTENRVRYTRKNIEDANQRNAVLDPVLQELWTNLKRKDTTTVMKGEW